MKSNILAFARKIILALAIMGMGAALTAHGQSYSVRDLGLPTGFTNGPGANSVAHAINTWGSVAGEWGADSSSERGFLYASGTNIDLGMLAGASFEAAYSVNASNLVVGEGESFVGGFYAFLYTNGALVDLTPRTIGVTIPYSLAHGINDQGKIVGESYVTSSEIHAVIFTGNQQINDLSTLSGGTYSAAYGINNSNVIVGESTVTSGDTYAFVYSNSVMTSLGVLPGGNYSAAFAINDVGQIVGEASTSSGETHAFLFQNGVMNDLGTLGGTNSSAVAINHSGLVVGSATTSDGSSHAFLYNGSSMLDLNNLISPSVCTNLTAAAGINDAGQIAATGYTPTGDKHAFLLTPILKLASPVMLAGPKFEFTVQGVPGQAIILQGSTNLTAWAPLATNTLIGGSTNWTDSGANTNLYRFYRAVIAH